MQWRTQLHFSQSSTLLSSTLFLTEQQDPELEFQHYFAYLRRILLQMALWSGRHMAHMP